MLCLRRLQLDSYDEPLQVRIVYRPPSTSLGPNPKIGPGLFFAERTTKALLRTESLCLRTLTN